MHPGKVNVQAPASPGDRLDGGAGQSRRSQVLDSRNPSGGQRFQTGLDQDFLKEWIADLHGWTQFSLRLECPRRQPRSAVDSVAPGFRPHQEQDLSRGISPGGRHPVLFHQANAQRVDQGVARV